VGFRIFIFVQMILTMNRLNLVKVISQKFYYPTHLLESVRTFRILILNEFI